MSVASWVIAVALAAPPVPPDAGTPATEAPPPAATPEPGSATEPAPAPSEPAVGPDEVVLKNGGFVRGEVVELLPDDRVVIIPEGTTDRREIPWAEVERVDRGQRPEPATIPTALPEATPQPSEASLGAPRLFLDVEGGKKVRLYEISSEISVGGSYGSMYGIQYRVVCESPCERVVDGTRGQDFFLARSMITASRRFSLAPHSGDVHMKVKPGNGGLRLTGLILFSLGIGVAVAGVILTIPRELRPYGLPMLGGGLGGIAIGTPMMILGRTRYKIAKK